jgi:hypothetical protein
MVSINRCTKTVDTVTLGSVIAHLHSPSKTRHNELHKVQDVYHSVVGTFTPVCCPHGSDVYDRRHVEA